MIMQFTLRPLPPFRLDYTVWALRRLPVNGMDRWDGSVYRRTVAAGDRLVEFVVTQSGTFSHPVLQVQAAPCSEACREELRRILERLLGLRKDLAAFRRCAGDHPRLLSLIRRFEGLKPPRFSSAFEALVNGIACQQLSLNVGIALLNRLTRTFGRGKEGAHAFPLPVDLARAKVSSVRSLGFSTRKAENIVGLARAVDEGRRDLAAAERLDDDSLIAELRSVPGVGRWTAQYTALRGFGRLNVFPADDVGSQSKLQLWLGLRERPDYEGMHAVLDAWAPYRGLIYFYLLLDHLLRRGLLKTGAASLSAARKEIIPGERR